MTCSLENWIHKSPLLQEKITRTDIYGNLTEETVNKTFDEYKQVQERIEELDPKHYADRENFENDSFKVLPSLQTKLSYHSYLLDLHLNKELCR